MWKTILALTAVALNVLALLSWGLGFVTPFQGLYLSLASAILLVLVWQALAEDL